MKFKNLQKQPWRLLLPAVLLGGILVLSGCDFASNATQIFNQIVGQIVQPATPTLPVSSTTITPAQTKTQPAEITTPSPELGILNLVIWVPPQFDPQLDSIAAKLLRDRIAEFEQANKDVFIQVRVKPASGPTGILESLSITSGAAEAAMPSIVALSRSDLETAVSRKLIYPFDSYSTNIDGEDWYQYARDMVVVGGSSYGLPFFGDALILVNRPDIIGAQPQSWQEALKRGEPLAFPAADPQALVALSIYQAAGGDIGSAQRIPPMDEVALTTTFQLFADGASAGVFPLWTTQIQKDVEAWTAYNELRSNWVITWSSRYLHDQVEDSSALSMPMIDKPSSTFVDGWVWCISDPQSEHNPTNARLIEFLTDPNFLEEWSSAQGALPVRPSSLVGWEDQNLRHILERVALSGIVKPRTEILTFLGPILTEQVIQILSGKTTAPIAAQEVMERVENP